MALSLAPEIVPLKSDVQGVLRVGNTRVTLDTVVAAFMNGSTAEEITQQYPSLALADVYSVIGYYLRRSSDVEEYLQERGKRRSAVRSQNESRFAPQDLRARLLARRAGEG